MKGDGANCIMINQDLHIDILGILMEYILDEACDIDMKTKFKRKNCWPKTDKRTINDQGKSTGVLPFSNIPE
ncbi:unnamed protein product [Sphenostylis stenocarpa]|uniref:Uncharacterized protein n=1 Tax=Sphenostylis stenocarpa TaxID=92480 RepID=A0AA86T4F8_9FABA|nr:unnamed protein product [Sphenostylis stenocarpa]